MTNVKIVVHRILMKIRLSSSMKACNKCGKTNQFVKVCQSQSPVRKPTEYSKRRVSLVSKQLILRINLLRIQIVIIGMLLIRKTNQELLLQLKSMISSVNC